MPPAGTIGRSSQPDAAAYCRAARRIRHVHARRPGRLYRELCALSGRHAKGGESAPARIVVPGARCEAFAAEVARRMDGPVLRQAERRALMRIARRTGIGRFEANLVIAAVQHRRATLPSQEVPEAVGSRRCLGPVALVVAVQALIAWGAWQVLWG